MTLRLKKTLLIAISIHLMFISPAYMINSQQCTFRSIFNEGFTMEAKCNVEYYVYPDFEPLVQDMEVPEIMEFKAERVYGNLTESQISQIQLYPGFSPEQLGILMTWTVKGKDLSSKKIKYFSIEIEKIKVTARGKAEDMIKITFELPRHHSKELRRKVQFEYIYRGADEAFFLNYDESYAFKIYSDDRSYKTFRTSLAFPSELKYEKMHQTHVVEKTTDVTIYAILSAMIVIVSLISFIVWKKLCISQGSQVSVPPTSVLILLNPGILDEYLKEKINTIATKLNRYSNVDVKYNQWNINATPNDWVTLQWSEAEVIVLISTPDNVETESKTSEVFNNLIMGKLWSKKRNESIILLSQKHSTHKNCRFFTSKQYSSTFVLGEDNDKSTSGLFQTIMKVTNPKPCPLIERMSHVSHV